MLLPFKPLSSLVVALILSAGVCAQTIQSLPSGTKASLRGLAVLDAHNVWVGGTDGTVMRSTDGGSSWVNVSPGNAAMLDFRDLEVFDGNTAYAMSAGAGTSSRIFKTIDGGKTWKQQYIQFDPKYFFDCFSFWDRNHGIAIGDPIGEHFELLETSDGGEHWWVVTNIPPVLREETAWATGSCITTAGEKDVWFGTGSKQGTRIFHSGDRGKTWGTVATPVSADSSGSGIFSVAFNNPHDGVVVGGNYQKPDQVKVNAAVSHNGGRTWIATPAQPFGYRSGVAFVPGSAGKAMVAVGTNGVDVTADEGAHWESVAKDRYNSIAFAPDGSVGFMVGPDGRIAKINWKAGKA